MDKIVRDISEFNGRLNFQKAIFEEVLKNWKRDLAHGI